MRKAKRATLPMVALALAGLAAVTNLMGPAGATHQPADKVAVAGSALEVLSAPLVEGASSTEATILSGSIKTSGPTDLIIKVTAECALWTDITVVGNDESEAVATVKVWVEIDGTPVPVSSDDTTEPGKVVFCNRAYRMRVTNLDDEDATFEQFLRTRQANGFNWVSLDLGAQPSPHSIVVKARLDAQVSGVGDAKAAIGKRTLVVLPEKLANDAVI